MAFNINTITGLEYLPGLTTLSLQGNNLTDIDVSQNTNLENLYLDGNQFTDAVINNLVLSDSLQELGLGNNQIVNFDPGVALPSSLTYLNLGSNQIVTFNPSIALPTGLTNLQLYENQIVTFNPSIALPNSLLYLYLQGNEIVTFNPTLPLPNSLQQLYLNNNQMTTAGYTASEPWANAMSVIPSRGNIYIYSNINSASGTNLKTILIAKGWAVNS